MVIKLINPEKITTKPICGRIGFDQMLIDYWMGFE